MKKSAVVLAFLALATGAVAEETQRYIVATKKPFRAGGMAAAVREARQSVSPRDVVGFESFDGFAAELTSSEVAALRGSGSVRWIEPVIERHAFAQVATQRRLDTQVVPYGVDLVRAREAWIARPAQVVNVVVVDSGVDYKHPELKTLYAGGVNFVSNNDDAMDDAGHGTHVAGSIAAANDTAGVVGVSPNVKLWAVKVLSATGSGTNEAVIRAVDWVIEKKQALGGKWVVNLSLGSKGQSTAEREAFKRGVAAGILFVAASGNDSTELIPSSVSYPAAYPELTAVGAVDRNLALATFSNQGPELDLVAPGVDVISSVPTGTGAVAYMTPRPGSTVMASTLEGAKKGSVTGEFVYCGLGGSASDFPASVAGKIALIQRGGGVRFTVKTQNAMNAGAIGVIIYNHDESPMAWTLVPEDDPASKNVNWPVTVGLTNADGEALRAQGTGSITITHATDDYGVMGGTSMASPHVAAAAAMVWSVAPNATPEQVIEALTATARDLGTTGADNKFGFGLINVEAAVRRIAPNAIDPTNPADGSRPATGRRYGKKG
jgi:serine protease